MAEEIFNIVYENLQNSNINALKLKQIYLNNKRDEFYSPNYEYEDYDEEIIEGESVLDCLLENVKREQKILEEYQQILMKTKEVKQQFLEYLKKIENIEKKFETNISEEIKKQEQNLLISKVYGLRYATSVWRSLRLLKHNYLLDNIRA